MPKRHPLPANTALKSGTPLWLQIVVMTLVIAPLIAIAQFIAYWRVDVVDDQMFAYFGWRIAHGATVYLDVWDNKPPGIYWINAIAMLISGGSYFGIIAMCVLAMIVAHVAFFVTAASVYHRGAAALGTIMLSFFLMHAFYTGGTNRTETFLVACELSAVALYMRGWACDRSWRWYVAGALCGVAFLFKQVGLAAWGCMGLHLIFLVLTGALAWRTGLRRCLLLLVGMLTPVALAAMYLALRGALYEAVFATFGFNAAYFATGNSRFKPGLINWYLLRNHVSPILRLPLLMALAATIHGLLWWLRPQYRPPEIERPLKALQPVCPKPTLLFAMWFVVAFYGALLSPHGFRHYLVPSIPPLMLFATSLINVLRAEASLINRLQQRAWVLVAFVVMGYFAYDAVASQFREVSKVLVFRFEQGERASWEDIADVVVKHTGPNDTIQCLGYQPGVYLHSRRLSATRFTTLEKVGQVGAGARFVAEELARKLHEEPPVLMIMTADEFQVLKPDTGPAGPKDLRLRDWLLENYQLVDEIPSYGTIYIFKRKDRVTPDDRDLRDQLPTPTAAVLIVPRPEQS